MLAVSATTDSWKTDLWDYCADLGCEAKCNEPLKGHTSMRVGGATDFFVRPKSIDQLASLKKSCAEKRVPFFIIGNGTNLIVNDRGFRGVVAKLDRLSAETNANGNGAFVQSGMLLASLVEYSVKSSQAGLEGLAGIPGSVGGAIFTNAGAYGMCIWDIMDEIWLLEPEGMTKSYRPGDFPFGYRTSGILPGEIILGATFRLEQDEEPAIRDRIHSYTRSRSDSQPLIEKSAGCIFKNPSGVSAAKLIEESGLKGLKIGSAKVSEKHANFIVNTNGAWASDVLSLVALTRDEVQRCMGVDLSLEVQVLGEYGLVEF